MKLSLYLQEVRYKQKTVLSDICINLPAGSFTTIIGRNGCGKSTVVSCIGGLIPYNGEITADGISLSAISPKDRAKRIAVMLQQIRTPHITVRDLVTFGRQPYLGIAEKLTTADRIQIDNALAEAELTQLADCYLDRISGGELRRAYLGMALAQDADILVLDEPTANMDMDHEAHFLEKLCALRNRGKTILTVMHNLEYAMQADQIVLLDSGKQLFTGSPADFLTEKWSERIFHAVPVSAENGRILFTHRRIYDEKT